MDTAFRAAGLHVIEQPGWATRGNDFWGPNEQPIGGMQHHTAPPVPFPVLNLYSSGRVKANFNVKPDGTIHLIAAGACNYSSGPGSRVVLNETRAGIAPSGTARNRGLVDNTGGNHWYINNETDHHGDGRPIPTPQYDACVTAWTVICNRYGWTPNRIVGHAEWTARKIDPYWNGRDAHRNLADMRHDISTRITDPPEVEQMLTLGSQGRYVRRTQRRLNRWTTRHFPHLPALNVDGDYGPLTLARVAAFQTWLDIAAPGDVDGLTAAELRNFNAQ